MLASALLNTMWAGAIAISLIPICIGIFWLPVVFLSLVEAGYAVSVLSGNRHQGLKSISGLGMAASLLSCNVLSPMLEVAARSQLSKPVVRTFVESQEAPATAPFPRTAGETAAAAAAGLGEAVKSVVSKRGPADTSWQVEVRGPDGQSGHHGFCPRCDAVVFVPLETSHTPLGTIHAMLDPVMAVFGTSCPKCGTEVQPLPSVGR